jgi:hypothetical protein
VLSFKGVCGSARWGGRELRSADLIIENRGQPFVLVALAKLVKAEKGMKFLGTDEWRYSPRKVHGGRDSTSFHIATVERAGADRIVIVRAENMVAIRQWTASHPTIRFDVEWTLMRENQSVLTELTTVVTHVELDSNMKTFAVSVTEKAR